MFSISVRHGCSLISSYSVTKDTYMTQASSSLIHALLFLQCTIKVLTKLHGNAVAAVLFLKKNYPFCITYMYLGPDENAKCFQQPTRKLKFLSAVIFRLRVILLCRKIFMI